MSTDLVKVSSNLPSTGLDNIKLTPSVIKLIQPMSKEKPEGCKDGQYVDTLDSALYNSLELIPLSVGMRRSYYLDPTDLSNPPICRSANGVEPIRDDDRLQPQADSCAECPKSKWGPRVKGKASKPECSLSYCMVALDAETRLPKVFYFKGLGVEALNNFLKLIKARVQVGKAKGKKLDLYSFSFLLKSAKAEKFAAYYPVIVGVKEHGLDVTSEVNDYVLSGLQLVQEEEFNQAINEVAEEV